MKTGYLCTKKCAWTQHTFTAREMKVHAWSQHNAPEWLNIHGLVNQGYCKIITYEVVTEGSLHV